MDRFEKVMLEVADRSLDELGSSVKIALLYHLERKGVKLKDVYENPSKFESAVKSMFGPAGEVLFSFILDRVSKEIGVDPPTGGSFTSRVEKLRAEYLKKVKKVP